MKWVAAQLVEAASRGSQNGDSRSAWGWIESVADPAELVRTVLLPALARSGRGAALISEIHEALDLSLMR